MTFTIRQRQRRLTRVCVMLPCMMKGYLLCLYCFLSVGCVSAAPAPGALTSRDLPEKSQNIYFLGVEADTNNAYIQRLQSTLGVSRNDSAALTNYVRERFSVSQPNLTLSDKIDQWNPDQDPYNFGAIALRDIQVRSSTWPDTGETWIYIMVELAWLHIGHDLRTKFASDKIPELRFSLLSPTVAKQVSDKPLGPAALNQLLGEVFNQALDHFAINVATRYEREINRHLADIRYVSVDVPIITDAYQKGLKNIFPHADIDNYGARLQTLLASQIEHKLMQSFAADPSFDAVVLLPNTAMLSMVRQEWPKFASRVMSTSSYRTSLEAIGFDTPKMLRIKPFCEATDNRENVVDGVLVRSALTTVQLTTDPIAGGELIGLHNNIVVDVKLPTLPNKTVHFLGKEFLEKGDTLPFIQGQFRNDRKKSENVPLADIVHLEWLPLVVTQTVDEISAPLTQRLAQTIAVEPALTHPTWRSLCP